MANLKQVADKIYYLNMSVQGWRNPISAYLIPEPEGVVVEPGPAICAPSIRAAMEQLGMTDLTYIIPTHVHIDHAGGSGTLAQAFPGATVLAHPRGAKHFSDPSRLIEGTRAVWGDGFEARFGPIVPIPESRIKVPKDGETISVNGRELQVVYAPGHAPHHMVIYDRSVQGLFCGEALGMPGLGENWLPLPAVAPPSFDQELYLSTMEKLRALGPRILFYSHGGVGLEPDKLISLAEETTRALGELILSGLRAGETEAAVGEKVRDSVHRRFGIELDEIDVELIVGGYSVCFRRKGLV